MPWIFPLLLLFWPHSSIIRTKLTRIDAVFSRVVCMVLLCAGKRIFRCLRKFQEKSQKIHARKDLYTRSGAKGQPGAPGALLARPHPWSRQEAAWEGPPSPGSLLCPLFITVARKPQNRSHFPNSRCGSAATLLGNTLIVASFFVFSGALWMLH